MNQDNGGSPRRFGNSNNNNRSGGFQNRNGGGNFRRNNNFNNGPREMHKAVCSECKKECEVPFKPTEGKPVFCKECYASKKGFN